MKMNKKKFLVLLRNIKLILNLIYHQNLLFILHHLNNYFILIHFILIHFILFYYLFILHQLKKIKMNLHLHHLNHNHLINFI
jgi:membrane protein YdbS with pleckstrin-like domain